MNIGVNGARKGIVALADGRKIPAYVKGGTYGEIAAELLISQLAQFCGLMVPEAALVYDQENNTLLSASIDAGYPNLFAAFPGIDSSNPDDLTCLCHAIQNWSDHALAVAFDEWIANFDRNLGNLLWNGERFILIDHGRSLGNYAPGEEDNKLILALLHVVTDELGKRRLLRKIDGASSAFDHLQAAESNRRLAEVPLPEIASFATRFQALLESRLDDFQALISRRFPVAGQPYLL
ncbi:hypothetical protein OL229_13690 [Neisseriaceae bacterium JH1-16]|nr:hypothetical protein [Neisseriaceae bacterium JH1-16]